MRNVFILFALIFGLTACTKEDNSTLPPPPPPEEEENNLPSEFAALYDIFDGEGIGAATNLNDDIILFISSEGTEYALFEDNEIKRTGNVNETGGLFDGLNFSAISSMIDIEEERIAIFNKDGNSYQWALLDPEMVAGNSSSNIFTFEETYGLWQWGVDYSCPFTKITAAFGFSKEAEGCATTEDDDKYLWMVDEDGDAVTRYVKENSNFDPSIELDQWRSNSICGGSPAIFPLSGIGAACVYDPDGGIYQELFFDPNGDKMTILTPSQGEYSEVFELN